MQTLTQFWNGDESGQGLLEYALLIGLIALAAVIAITAFGDELAALFQGTADALPDAPATGTT